jgi:hypothetical protein
MQGVAFRPTEEQRRTVRAMSGFGIPQEQIATLLEVEPKTLRKHFRRELDRGSVEATAKVAQSLFRMATEGNNVAAAIFWMKARAGWREKQEVRVEVRPTDQLSDAELEAIIRMAHDDAEAIGGECDEVAAIEGEQGDEP